MFVKGKGLHYKRELVLQFEEMYLHQQAQPLILNDEAERLSNVCKLIQYENKMPQNDKSWGI
jgi:hypothetical protein